MLQCNHMHSLPTSLDARPLDEKQRDLAGPAADAVSDTTAGLLQDFQLQQRQSST